ncbi:MAG: DUF2207 domain-containing protein, partial [bacterium]
MKKFSLLSIIFSVALVFSLLPCYAGRAKAATNYEKISSFSSEITVHKDSTISVKETILYDSAGAQKHGIIRDIRALSYSSKPIILKNISVVGQDGAPISFEESNKLDHVISLKIGDPNQTFSGQREFIISYDVSKVIGYFKDYDEIYWNVTGNEWLFPIENVTSKVFFDEGITPTQSSCYFGEFDVNNSCLPDGKATSSSITSFYLPSDTTLYMGDGMTVAVRFAKGEVSAPTQAENRRDWINKNWPWIFTVILPLSIFIIMFLKWDKDGKDPKGTGVIVPEYDSPENLTPMEVSGILHENVRAKDISAEIIYLATKGYIKIRQIGEDGFLSPSDYELTLLKNSDSLEQDSDKRLLDGLFETDLIKIVNTSDLEYSFYKQISLIFKKVFNSLVTRGYYHTPPSVNRAPLIAYVFLGLWASLFFTGIFSVISAAIFSGESLFLFPLMFGIFVSAIVVGFFMRIMPSKTKHGMEVKEQILGLKMYLEVAEKDRINFHNAPEKKPEIFEKLLPYAMVLGVEKEWAKEFEGIYTAPPDWYEGVNGSHFSTLVFVSSISSFSRSASSSLASRPSSSGG